MAHKETPKPFMVRLYKEQRANVKKLAKMAKVPAAETIRRAIDKFQG
ncbi:hypothetical protein [Bradyrhizobium sp. McL0616]